MSFPQTISQPARAPKSISKPFETASQHSPSSHSIPPICTQKPSVTTTLQNVTERLQREFPCRILFKNELEQPSGSFKLRGIGHLIQKSVEKAHQTGAADIHVFASSGGNAGLAAAYSAQFYRVKCTVVVPVYTGRHIVQKLREFGAKVMLSGQSISEADVHARQLMARAGAGCHTIYCHPFDNPLIWEGHSQIVDEIFEQLPPQDFAKVRAVACSVGGGGLYNGIMSGLKAHGSYADCLLVETSQAPTLSKAVAAGEVVTLQNVKSMATSLACSYVSEPTLKLFQDQSTNKSHLHLVDDLQAVKASLDYYRDFGSRVEPACGAALSVVYQTELLKKSLPDLKKDDIVVVVVCGGSCVDETTLANYRQMFRNSRM